MGDPELRDQWSSLGRDAMKLIYRFGGIAQRARNGAARCSSDKSVRASLGRQVSSPGPAPANQEWAIHLMNRDDCRFAGGPNYSGRPKPGIIGRPAG